MLKQPDVPLPWRLVETRSAEALRVDEILEPRPTTAGGVWCFLENDETGAFARIRVSPTESTWAVIDAVMLVGATGESVKPDAVRLFPLAKIEDAMNLRVAASDRGIRAAIDTALGGAHFDPSGNLGPHDDSPRFLAEVALSWMYLAQHVPGPTAVLAMREDVTEWQASRWVTAARARGFLPPGRRGRRPIKGPSNA